jgi:membrane protein DedA with SNARE-associated domain
MHIPSSNEIPDFLRHLSYTGIFLWFLLTQLIFIMPIPEEAVLLSIGYVAATGVWNPFAAAAVAFAALLVADVAFYSLSMSGNRYVARLVKRSEGGAFAKAEAQMRRSMPRTVFTLTFIPRVRFFGPVLAGALKLKWPAFFLADCSAQVIHTAVYVCIGYFFHRSLQVLFKKMTIVHDVIFIAALVVIGIIVGVVAGKRWSASKRDAAPPI